MAVTGYARKGKLKLYEVRFAGKPAILHAVCPVHYLSCVDSGPRVGFVRQPVSTILLDLSRSDEELLTDTNENTRYEIRRALRDQVAFHVASDSKAFLLLYNAASQHKSLPPTDCGYLKSYGSALEITEAHYKGRVLAAHVHVTDVRSGRARLIRSASAFHELDKPGRAMAGRANRFLHFQDFLYFKGKGFKLYDMGGYDPPGTAMSAELERVSKFKSGFGGEVIKEANYISLALFVYRSRHRILRTG